jgi:hypothetical protein
MTIDLCSVLEYALPVTSLSCLPPKQFVNVTVGAIQLRPVQRSAALYHVALAS